MGVLHERLGEFHIAYQCHKWAFEVHRYNLIARAGMKRCCARFGLNSRDRAINSSPEGTPMTDLRRIARPGPAHRSGRGGDGVQGL
jgi:hypothetical protein